MGLYNFKERFAQYVAEGSKCHTIRAHRKRTDKPGDMCHLYTGLRRKGARLLRRAECTGTELIEIYADGTVVIELHELSDSEKDLLAWRDGFRIPGSSESNPEGCFEEMLSFWTGRLPFFGHVIHWKAKDSESRKGIA